MAAHVRLVAQVVQEAEALVEHLPHPHLTQVQQEPLTLAAVEVAGGSQSASVGGNGGAGGSGLVIIRWGY